MVRKPDETPVEMLLTRYTYTATGDPVPLATACLEYGAHIHPSGRPGWFWTPATPTSARHLRAAGQKAVGSLFTTWVPPQTPVMVVPTQEPTGARRRLTKPDAVAPEVFVAEGAVNGFHYRKPGQLDVMVELPDSSAPLVQITGVTSVVDARAAFLDAWLKLGVEVASTITSTNDVEF